MFYDEISAFYDEMIPFDKRVASLSKQLKPLVEKYNLKSALDIGAATGATCIALRQMGAQSAGLELAPDMVKIAKQRSREYKFDIPFICGDALNRKLFKQQKFDSIFILANTISHLLDKKSLNNLLANFKHWLTPGGHLFIQLLNYSRILKDRERIVKIYNNEKRTFIRFYDFEKTLINFNLLVVENQKGVCNHQLSTVPLRGWQSAEIKSALENKGYIKIKRYANFAGDRFLQTKANDLVFVCQKK